MWPQSVGVTDRLTGPGWYKVGKMAWRVMKHWGTVKTVVGWRAPEHLCWQPLQSSNSLGPWWKADSIWNSPDFSNCYRQFSNFNYYINITKFNTTLIQQNLIIITSIKSWENIGQIQIEKYSKKITDLCSSKLLPSWKTKTDWEVVPDYKTPKTYDIWVQRMIWIYFCYKGHYQDSQ